MNFVFISSEMVFFWGAKLFWRENKEGNGGEIAGKEFWLKKVGKIPEPVGGFDGLNNPPPVEDEENKDGGLLFPNKFEPKRPVLADELLNNDPVVNLLLLVFENKDVVGKLLLLLKLKKLFWSWGWGKSQVEPKRDPDKRFVDCKFEFGIKVYSFLGKSLESFNFFDPLDFFIKY